MVLATVALGLAQRPVSQAELDDLGEEPLPGRRVELNGDRLDCGPQPGHRSVA